MDSVARLKDLKTRLNQAMPESDDELERAEKSNQVPTDNDQVPSMTLLSQTISLAQRDLEDELLRA